MHFDKLIRRRNKSLSHWLPAEHITLVHTSSSVYSFIFVVSTICAQIDARLSESYVCSKVAACIQHYMLCIRHSQPECSKADG